MEQHEVQSLAWGLITAVFIARGARSQGDSAIVWFVVCIIGGPFYALAVLPVLPNRKLIQRRLAYRAELDAELARARAPATSSAAALPYATVSDQKTVSATTADRLP